MSIATELTLLANSKQAIKNSINQKGGSITDSTPFADYSTAIDNLPSGGSGNPLLTSIDVSDFSGTTFNDARRYITEATIPSGVTIISWYAFQNAIILTNVTVPNTIVNFGQYCFSGCYALASIRIPESTTTIEHQAFENCRSLTTIAIPDSVTTIDYNAFEGCTSLENVTLGTGITRLSDRLFSGCTSLTNINIPNSVTAIGAYTFTGCSSLMNITIPNSVTSIGNYAFYGCTYLTSVIVNSTTPPTIGSNVFDNTNNCPIYVPAESVDTYKAASGWSSYALRIVAIGDSILFTPTNGDPAISVKNYELATANYVQSTDVPASIKNGAGSLEICEGVTRIGTFTFQSGSSLTSVTIPSTITRIDNAAFDGCSSLASITVKATTPPTLYAAAFDNTNNCPIYVPAASVAAYQAASGWSTYASRIQAIPTE